ncbi:MAG TPA: hypothetical protein VF590_20865 [Isosphaeraceae bacterium]|jgi:hypothetical protein
MAIQIEAARPRRRRGASGGGPSVREVCLLGAGRPPMRWDVGAEVRWEGRLYRVAAAAPPQAAADGDARRYVHLTPAAAGL